MKIRNAIVGMLASTAVCCAVAAAQAPVANIDPQRHGVLAAAQNSIIQAYELIGNAQRNNDDHLGGHAQKAKDLLSQASDELRFAADVANQNEQQNSSNDQSGPPTPAPSPVSENTPPPPPPNLSGNWTIYAYNVNKPGSSLKQVQLSQNGNIISGTFHGPHQHGKLQGWINGTHVEFSTDTNDVLTFRGDITATGMSGLYGIHGQHAPWTAERTN